MAHELLSDPLLKGVPVFDGFKVLKPCVLYELVGRGGMGVVYRGRHLSLDIDVAVKFLLPDLEQKNPRVIARFQREAKIAAHVTHQNLIRVFSIHSRFNVHYIVMEYVWGETAKACVKRRGPLPEREALTILLEAAEGLAAAHVKNIVHRDVKPDNILISAEGDVKVADLGLAKAAGEQDFLTATGAAMGTPNFMPPEQWYDTRSVGPAGDVYALGATLYFLLAGRPAITGSSQAEIMSRICSQPFPDVRREIANVSSDVALLLRRCTQKKPDERIQNGRELAEELLRILGGERERLVQAETGTGSRRFRLQNPPPRETIARIKSALLGTGSPKASEQPLRRYLIKHAQDRSKLPAPLFSAVAASVSARSATRDPIPLWVGILSVITALVVFLLVLGTLFLG